MTDAAKKARNEYLKKWRLANKEKVHNYLRAWRAANPDKVRKYNETFWEKKAAELEANDEKNS